MARYGLLGEHLGHSYSPQIHALLGSAPYGLFEIAPDEVGAFIRNGGWDGINVTVPYKKRAAELADTRSARVEALGAANTLVRRDDGSIFAENTDALGFAALLEEFSREKLGRSARDAFAGRKVLVLGTGGAAQAVSHALGHIVDAHPLLVSRSGAVNYETICASGGDASLIVNATPVGMYPHCPASPLRPGTIDRFPDLLGVIDIIYNPRITGLCLEADARGIPWMTGLPMLVWQAAYASGLFLGREPDESRAAAIIERIDRRNANIALIGMPGSGKTSAGRCLACMTSRAFVDLDDAFTARVGSTPEEVIANRGEAAFRELETEICREHAGKSGLVIATGGGIVARACNYPLIHQNSTIVFLDRPLEELSSAGRPLSQTQGIDALAQDRLPRYRSWADATLSCTGSAEGDAEAIRELLGL